MRQRDPNKPAKLPKGSRLSLVETEGLTSGAYHLYDLRGLSLGKVELIVNLLKQAQLDHNPLAADIMAAMPDPLPTRR